MTATTAEARSQEPVYEVLRAHPDYEICVEYPHKVRGRDNHRIISEHEHSHGYICLYLNNIRYFKHRIIAEQWIENDNPENKLEVDHINHVHSDNRITNLRWVTHSENLFNRSSYNGIVFEYADEIPDNSVPIILYRGFEFEGYFMSPDGDVWFNNGEQFRKLFVNVNSSVYLYDIHHIRHQIGI